MVAAMLRQGLFLNKLFAVDSTMYSCKYFISKGNLIHVLCASLFLITILALYYYDPDIK